MAITVTMPQLGETVTEGTILSWAKQPGDEVAEDEVLLEISTDKVDTEVPSPATGVLQEILVAEGETVEVGTALAVIAGAGEATAAPAAGEAAPAAEEVAPAAEQPPEPAPAVPQPVSVETQPATAPAPAAVPAATATAVVDGPRRGVLSPVVRRLASEHQIDLDSVPGTGEGGRITRKDVMAYIESGGAAAAGAVAPDATPPTEIAFEEAPPVATPPAPAPPAPAPPAPAQAPATVAAPPPEVAAPAAAAPAPAAPAPAAPAQAPEPAAPALEPVAPAPAPAAPAPTPVAPAPTPSGEGDQVIELTRLRRRIAENMVQAKATAAHVWASIEVDYEAVERVRHAHKDAWKAKEGFSLTYLPFIARATMDALAAYPVVNSSFLLDEGRQIVHGRVNLGIAVDMNQQGLVVVSVRGADSLQLAGLAREIRAMAIKARDGKLEPDDISGSTFTITNPGPFGSFMTNPIINVPNVGILSTDTVTKRPTVVTLPDGSDAIAIHHIGYLGLTWDHRAFDGSTAVLFLNRIKSNLESWDWEQELA